MPKNFIQIIQGLVNNGKNNVSPVGIVFQPAHSVSSSTPASLELVYNLIQGRLSVQKDQWTSLDVKINFILGYATALVSASLILQAVLLTLYSTHGSILYNLIPLFPAQLLSIICLLFLLVFYIITVILGIFAYKPRTYRFVPDPEEVFQKWLNKEEVQTKQKMVETMIEVFNLNQIEINKKVRLIDFALATLFVEAFLLVPLIVIQVFS